MRKLSIPTILLLGALCAQAQWSAVAPAPESRSRPAGALVGDTFYLMGGETAGGARNVTCWKLDIPGNTWSSIADMPHNGSGNGGVSNIDAAALGTDIYLIGGYNGAAGSTRVLRYDTVGDTWTEETGDPCPVAVYANACVAAGGKIYVIGGNQGGAVSGGVQIYDPSAASGSRWSTGASMSVARQYPGSCEIGGMVYVAGGIGTSTTDQKTSAEVYDPGSNTWTTLASMSLGRGGPALYNLGGKPYCVAGGWSQYYTSSELLDEGLWSAGDPCNVGVRTLAFDGNESYLVKSCGWSGAYRNDTEVYSNVVACEPCDTNCDGSINGQDIGGFVNALNGNPNNCSPCNSDADGNGSVNGQDIDDFILCLNPPPPPPAWVPKTAAPEGRSRAAAAMLSGNVILLAGGETAGGARNVTCWKYDIAADSWTAVADMPSNGVGNGGVSNVDAAAIGNTAYVIGGFDGLTGYNRVLSYDAGADTWTEDAGDPCPVALYAHAVVALGGKVYVLSGNQDGVVSTACWVYDPAATPGTRWSSIASMSIERQYAGAAAVNGKIVVAGGIGATSAEERSSAEEYDPGTNTWTSLADMSTPRGGTTLFDYEGEAYVATGGWATYLNSGERYSAGAWSAAQSVGTGVRTVAYDGNATYLVKIAGWNGGYSNVTEVLTLP